jgi:hypothetical protein
MTMKEGDGGEGGGLRRRRRWGGVRERKGSSCQYSIFFDSLA